MAILKNKKKQDKSKPKSISKVKNWYQDRYETILIQRNMLVLCIIAFIAIFGVGLMGVIKLNNSKVYEPFIVQIEESTGVITKVNNSAVRELPAEKAVRNSSLVRYIIARESYNYADYKFNYFQIVRLMSDKNVYQAFNAIVSPESPSSPISLGFDSRIDIRIKSLIDLDDKQNLVQVRIGKAKIPSRLGNTDAAYKDNEKSYIITLRYQYKNLDLSETERYINPLGIQIIAYSINEEVNAKNI